MSSSLGPAPTYTSRPAGFGEELYDDLPDSDWVKWTAEGLLAAFLIIWTFMKFSKQAKFEKAVNMSAEMESNLSPEMRRKVSEASGLGWLGSAIALTMGGLFMAIMWMM